MDHITLLCHFSRGLHFGRTHAQKAIDGSPVAVSFDDQRISALKDVFRHPVPHQTNADESNR